MDIVFYFHFYDHNNDVTPSRSLVFYVTNVKLSWHELNERIESCAEHVTAKYDKYCGLFYTRVNVMGYSSSNIEEPLQDQVMGAWRTIFLTQFIGCGVSDVFDVTHVKDTEMFEHTQHMYEQQQAQQLRATLNANITTTASTAAVKKI